MKLLTLDDITDVRAYEKERETFRAHIIALKKKRRVHVGPIVTFLFENHDTMRFQIQEMTRAEKIISDEKIEHELDVYNELIPTTHALKTTMLIELVSEEELREWLPKLPGIQDYLHLDFAGTSVAGVEPDAERLSREEEITTTVHYVVFEFTDEQRKHFLEATEGVVLRIDHPEYKFETTLLLETVSQLQTDLMG